MANGHTRGSGSRRVGLLYPPSLIQYRNMRFLIMDAPSDSNLSLYIAELQRMGVTDLVRACERTYVSDPIIRQGINVHDLNFKDGHPPPAEIVASWLNLIAAKFLVPKPPDRDYPTIAVHCVAGLGRAPVLVAIALIEAGMDSLEAMQLIRDCRPRTFNTTQIHYLESYKRRGKFRASKFPETPSSELCLKPTLTVFGFRSKRGKAPSPPVSKDPSVSGNSEVTQGDEPVSNGRQTSSTTSGTSAHVCRIM